MFSPAEIDYQEHLKKQLAKDGTVEGWLKDHVEHYLQHDAECVHMCDLFIEKEPLARFEKIGLESYPAEIKIAIQKLSPEEREYFASMPDRKWIFPMNYKPWTFKWDIKFGRGINAGFLLHTLEGEVPTLIIYLDRDDPWNSDCFWSTDVMKNPEWFVNWSYAPGQEKKMRKINEQLEKTFGKKPKPFDFDPPIGWKFSGETYTLLKNVLGRKKLKDLEFWHPKPI